MGRRTATLDLWEAKVYKTDDCWLWTGALSRGYGVFARTTGHRWAYEHFIGPVPDGLDLDHTCHTRDRLQCLVWAECQHRRCVNPSHLEPVTRRVNLLRGNTLAALNVAKTCCPQGHEYTSENTYLSSGRRYCVTCKRRRSAESRARKRAP